MKLKNILDYKKLIIFIFIILLADKTDFIKNFIKIITIPYSDRLIKIYGYCGGESIGYLMYLKKNYNFTHNPKIINYIHTPQVDWAIINTKKLAIDNDDNDNLIILNYPKSEYSTIKRELSKNIKDNFSLSIDLLNVKTINKINIISKNKEFTPITAELIISNKINTKKKFYKKIKINNSSINNLEINQLVDIYYEFDPYDKLYINILDKNNANINKNINLVIIYFKNEINLKDFNIIDNFENCYYIKKK